MFKKERKKETKCTNLFLLRIFDMMDDGLILTFVFIFISITMWFWNRLVKLSKNMFFFYNNHDYWKHLKSNFSIGSRVRCVLDIESYLQLIKQNEMKQMKHALRTFNAGYHPVDIGRGLYQCVW